MTPTTVRSTRRTGPDAEPPTRTIAVLAPFVGGFYFGNLLAGAARAAAVSGHALLVVQTFPAGLDRGEDPEAPPHDAQVVETRLAAVRLATRAASGLVVISNALPPGELARLYRLGKPMVLVSGEVGESRMPLARPDNEGGIRSAVDHLVRHGHRRIGFVGTLVQSDLIERYEAYRRGLIGHGITPDPDWLFEAGDTLEGGGRAAGAALVAAGLPTTALIAATDRNALGVLEVLAEAGLSLPGDQAVIGFDNTGAGARATPRLSSVEPHFDRVGELAVQLLSALRRGGPVRRGRYRTPTSLVLRESCGCSGATPGAAATEGPGLADRLRQGELQGQLETSIAAQVEIGMELLRPGRTDPRRLDWLSAARVSAACLALWTDPADGSQPRLRVAGVHDRNGSLGTLIGSQLSLGDFPPVAVRQRCLPGRGEAVIVIPVTTQRRGWGLLAVVGSVEHRATSVRDDYNHWATLLGVALEQDELLSSQRRQQEDLEQAYRRERRLAETIRASEERYALVVAATNDGLWDWDVSRGVVYYSPRWKSMLGYAADEIGDTPGEWLDRVHPDHREELAAAIAAQLGGARSQLELEHQVRTAAGGYRWVLCRALTVLDDAGCPARLVGAFVDLADRKALEQQLRQGALRDPVTGLPNRALFLDRLEVALARARRHPADDFALLVIRLTAPAPGAGPQPDGVIGRLGRRLAAELGELDSAGRLGPAELVVLLADAARPDRDPPAIAARIEAALTAELGGLRLAAPLPGLDCALTAGCRRYDSTEAVLRAADIAWHRAAARRRPRPVPGVLSD